MEVQKVNDSIYLLTFIGIAGGLLLALSVILFYIRYQRRFIRQQTELQRAELVHRQHLLNATIQSQENERKRISRELHDHVGSSLSTLRFLVAKIGQASKEQPVISALAEDYKKGIDRIIEDVRNISHSLSPAGLELWGFHDAMEEYFEKTCRTAGMEVTIADNTDKGLNALVFDDALSLFRVMQELLNNTVKHAGAKQVSVHTKHANGSVLIHYADNGKGMAVKAGRGIGTYNMESRLSTIDASYEVITSPGAGYKFNITVPAARLINKQDHG
jgi:signal transduction histidine kinase